MNRNIDICFSSSEDEEPTAPRSNNVTLESILKSQTVNSSQPQADEGFQMTALPGITNISTINSECHCNSGSLVPLHQAGGSQLEPHPVNLLRNVLVGELKVDFVRNGPKCFPSLRKEKKATTKEMLEHRTNIQECSLEERNNAAVEKQLENIQKRQLKLQKLLMQGFKLDTKEKTEMRSEYKELQMLLTKFNKEFLSQKKHIKESRDSQLEQGSPQCQVKYDGLLKKAKKLVVQQKCLVNLLKTQRELAPYVSKLFQCSEPQTISELLSNQQASNKKQQPRQNQQHQQRQQPQQRQQSCLFSSKSKKFNIAQNIESSQTLSNEHCSATSKTPLLKKLIDAKIIFPGINVLSIVIKGIPVVSTLREDGMIISSSGVYASAEEWIYKERSVSFTKKTVLQMVKFAGNTIATLIRNYKLDQSSTKDSCSSSILSQQVMERASMINMKVAWQAKKKFSLENRAIEATSDSSIQSTAASITSSVVENIENFSQSQIVVSVSPIPDDTQPHTHPQFTSGSISTSSNKLQYLKKIKTYETDEFVECNDMLPPRFSTVGFETLNLYGDLVAGCGDF